MTNFAWGNTETEFFLELTPDKILNAVESAGFICTGRTLQLNSMENRVYEVEIEVTGEVKSVSERYKIVKFYRPGRWSKEQISEEHQFLLDLIDYDIPVIAPIKFPDGDTINKLPEIDLFFSIFPKAGGRIPDELNDDQLIRVGRLLARLHNVGATKQAEHRISLDTETYGFNNLDYLLDADVLPDVIRDSYTDIVESICNITCPWFDEADVQRIHGDCHLGNLIWSDSGLLLVDFDDMVTGPCVQDIWLLVPGRDDYAKEKLSIILKGYEEMRNFDRSTLRLIEPLRALRMVHFNAWISKRWQDQAFPRAFPEFGTEKYWQEQHQALHEQLEIIHTGGF